MTNLQQIMDFIESKYVFSEENYPSLKGWSEAQRQAFAITHSVLHMNKSVGRIAGECESYDHGGDGPNNAIVREATVKMLINTLKLAEELGMTAEDLAKAIPVVMRSK